MADLRAFRALRYTDAAGPLSSLIAPPYDVTTDLEHERLLAGSPRNVVAVDQPRVPEGGDRHLHAADLLAGWSADGLLEQEREEALWVVEQAFADPRTGERRVRRGVLGLLRAEPYAPERVRPHERTHRAPVEDRFRLTAATQASLSPILVLHPGDAVGPLAAGLDPAPTARATGLDATVHTIWRVSDPARIAAARAALADAELLIADGHHRYAAALRHASQGGPPWLLALLVSLEDPGLVVLPTHRVLAEAPDLAALRARLAERFVAEPVGEEELAPPDPPPGPDPGPLVLGYLDADATALRLRLRDPAADPGLPAGTPAVLRDLDTARVERLVLAEAAGYADEEQARRHGLIYARTADEAIDQVRRGVGRAAFLLRATPIEQVLAVARAGEVMPPKSTSFVPKAPAGLLFAPLSGLHSEGS